MIPLTSEERKIHRKQKVCYICIQEFSTDDDNKKHHKVRDHCSSRKQSNPGHFFKSQGKTFQPFLYTLF